MTLRIDKCKTFGIIKYNSSAKQYFPKIYVNHCLIPAVKWNESLCCLGRFYNCYLTPVTSWRKLIVIQNISQIYIGNICSRKYLGILLLQTDGTWIKQTLDTMCLNKFRTWLEIPPNGTLDILVLGKSKFAFDINDVSTKITGCQVVLRNKVKDLSCLDTQNLYFTQLVRTVMCSTMGSLPRNMFPKKLGKPDKISNIESKLTSQSLLIKSIWRDVFEGIAMDWHSAVDNLP